MAFRIEKTIGAILIFSVTAGCQPLSYQVRHRHLHGGKVGTLQIDADSISFQEQSKNGRHSHQWKYGEIQQLSLSSSELKILTYDDQKWELGRDRDFIFDHLPEGMAKQIGLQLQQKLKLRFVAELGEQDVRPLWQVGAKLRHGLSGSQGTLLLGEDRLAYQSEVRGESRTWRFEDIDNISASGPFDLSITTLERFGWRHASPTEFRFQLKDALSEQRYNDLWRRFEAKRTSAAEATGSEQ